MRNDSERYALLNAASYANGYNPLINCANAVGYRPNAFRYAERNSLCNLAEDYLLNSYTTRADIENHGSLEQYMSDAELTMLSMMENRSYGEAKKIILPDSIPLDLSIGDSILRRRSVRTYTGDVITLQHMASVLRAANGITSHALVRSSLGNSIPIPLRTVSSAGGLYPVNLYIVALNVNKLKKGIYEYSPQVDALYQVEESRGVEKLLKTYAVSDEDISFSRATYIILLVGNVWKSMRKYGNKGLRFLFQELGSVTQNIHLATVSLGLGSVDCAAYYENEMNTLLKMDGVNRSVLHTIVSGIYE